MPWPDIFFKAKKPRPEPEANAPVETPKTPPAETKATDAKSAAAKSPDAKPAETKTDVVKIPESNAPATTPLPPPVTKTAKFPEPEPKAKTAPIERGTQTIPVTHGVVLRPPARVVIGPPAGEAPKPLKNIEELMAEADPVKTLRQTGSVHLLKRLAPDPSAPPLTPKSPEAVTKPLNTPPPFNPTPIANSPWPSFAAKAPVKPVLVPPPVENKKPETVAPAPVPLEVKMPEPVLISTPVEPPVLAEVAKKLPFAVEEDESPFILKQPPAAPPVTPTVTAPPPEMAAVKTGAVFHRKAKLADVARIVLPPKREETSRLPPPPTNSTVVPPAFPVASMTQRVSRPIAETPVKETTNPTSDSPFLERKPASPPVNFAPPIQTPLPVGDAPPAQTPPPFQNPPPVQSAAPSPSAPLFNELPKLVEPAPSAPAPSLVMPEMISSLFPDPPKVDPQAHKPEQIDLSLPKVDPEAHRPPPTPASAPAPTPAPGEAKTETVPPDTREKREFHLTNGEHIAGVVLSETPEAVYVEHATLGVVTVPRKEIAKRLVEIILTNGDRIVGDIMAETADSLYVRHAALGMLTVPRSHRSTRVVEAILKDGDRILGEVLTETDAFTVIRSATLGTITVPHSKLAMMNRKVEQIEMKTLPPPAPELKDKT